MTTLRTQEDIELHRSKILESIESSSDRINSRIKKHDSLGLFHAMKFDELGCDPLDKSKAWNLVEQINQTFTYLVSMKAAEVIFLECKSVESIECNLGTSSGYDLIGRDKNGGILVAAEVFSAVKTKNNGKLRKDVLKVMESKASHMYVFFSTTMVKDCNPYLYYEPKFDASSVKIVSFNSKTLLSKLI